MINNLFKKIEEAEKNLNGVVKKTPIEFCSRISKKVGAEIYFKREDLQEIRSFKIRGAFNKIKNLSEKEKKKGIVTASAGNHAQGVAFSCTKLKIKGIIFMSEITPYQKIERVKYFGGDFIEIKLEGENFDITNKKAKDFAEKKAVYIPPFDDLLVIAGQGVIGKEIYEDFSGELDYVLVPIGGGGLISGIATYLKEKNPKIKIIGVEPIGAANMCYSLKKNKIMALKSINTFCDGVAVKEVGKLTFKICQKYVDKVLTVPDGVVAQTMIELYQNEGIIVEPAAALSVAVLEEIKKEIKNKKVVCLLSGGNNDILRYPEILEKSLVWQGKKHYFIVEFIQRPGRLKKFLNDVLGPDDDIILFEYIKKNNKERGPVFIGIELKNKKDLKPLLERMEKEDFNYQKITDKDLLYHYLV